MTLHLVRIPVDRHALATYALVNRSNDDDGGYALHLALRRRFGEAGPQPFRFIAEQAGDAYLLGYAGDPATLAEMAGLPAADPLLAQVFPAAPQARAMPAAWRTGARYGFAVRVRPVVRFGPRVRAERAGSAAGQAPDGWWARAGEVDAWIAGRTRPGGDPALTREAAYAAWLAARLKDAATLETVELEAFRRIRARRSSHGRPGRARVEGPDAVMTGTLAVADPAAFADALARGIGRHAAFGYGMLLLSPPRRGG